MDCNVYPNFTPAMKLVQEADIFVVIGTSLVVYPAASLINCVRPGKPIFYIDPNPAHGQHAKSLVEGDD